MYDEVPEILCDLNDCRMSLRSCSLIANGAVVVERWIMPPRDTIHSALSINLMREASALKARDRTIILAKNEWNQD